MVLAPGDRMVEYYCTDRWYNVLEIYASQGHTLKGWYCNLCRPARVKGTVIEVEDLALDLFVSPSGATLVLDEDEFALLPLPAAERHQVEAALADLRARARNAQSPFEQLLEGKPRQPGRGGPRVCWKARRGVSVSCPARSRRQAARQGAWADPASCAG